MSIGEIVMLSAIVAMFVTFGATLFGVRWYCEHAPRPHNRGTAYPRSPGLITDDD